MKLVWIFCTPPRSWKSTPLSFASFKDHCAMAFYETSPLSLESNKYFKCTHTIWSEENGRNLVAVFLGHVRRLAARHTEHRQRFAYANAATSNLSATRSFERHSARPDLWIQKVQGIKMRLFGCITPPFCVAVRPYRIRAVMTRWFGIPRSSHGVVGGRWTAIATQVLFSSVLDHISVRPVVRGRVHASQTIGA